MKVPEQVPECGAQSGEVGCQKSASGFHSAGTWPPSAPLLCHCAIDGRGYTVCCFKACYEANTVLVTSDKGGDSPETGLGRPGMHVLLGVTAETAAAGRSLR